MARSVVDDGVALMGSMSIGLGVTADMMPELEKALKELQSQSVYAGFPEGEDPREGDDPINNATLGYIHNGGAPEANIPARPFMVEGIEQAEASIVAGMELAGASILDGDMQTADKALHAVGMAAQDGIKGKLNDGPFDPLAESTLKARERRGVERTNPLIDTGQMRNAVSYAIRKE